MKTTVSATAILIAAFAFAGNANAACNVTATSIASHIASGNHTETDCASAATVAAQGIVISDHEGRITVNEGDIATLQTENGAQQVQIDANTAGVAANASDIFINSTAIGALQSENAAQQTEIDAGAAKNVEQDGRLDDVEDKNADQDGTLADHETRITTNKNKNDQQDATLTNHEGRITSNTAKNVQQDTRLDGHDVAIAGHETRLNAHDAMLSQHAATLESYGDKLDDHSKGLAIAMSLPDAWLSDTKKFGIFGSVGGFDDETAVGFAAIGRIDENWSLNAKLGADTSFEHFGWQVGAGAQW